MTINNKTILVLAIAAAFVAGTMTSGTAFAKEQPNGQPFQAIWAAIEVLQSQIDSIGTGGTELYTKTTTHLLDPTTDGILSNSCNAGDTIVNGYVKQFTSDSEPRLNNPEIVGYNFNGLNGYLIEFSPNTVDGLPETYDFVIVCAKGTLPEN